MDTPIHSSTSLDIESAVYEAALSLDGEAREEFLKQFYRGNEGGLERMRRLLRRTGKSTAFFLEAHEHQGRLAEEILEDLPEPAGPAKPGGAEEEPGVRIGSYRLIERIGEGGYGVVYEAEQEEPFHRRVALKIIRLGMDTENVIARFEAERQALALMDHPNIARVFDAGSTPTGRPYFVMERVTGERITTWCDRERLDLRRRIDLFVRVCQGIQHAHQKGVIHRDIKPSNILVTLQDGEPVPKVIDFGIAKAAAPMREASETIWTSRDQLIGTPPYMSPEQVDFSGLKVDTRSDVYSLGALLYELLGGRPPFDGKALAGVGVSEMRRILLEEEPPRLSRMLASLPPGELAEIAAARQEEPARLIAKLRGDLEGIVSMAMAKEPERRYQTVHGLAADLQRYLACEPVKARPPGRLYLVGKFVRRNRLACALGAAIVVSLAGGFGTSMWLFLNERRALLEQERLGREAEIARAREAHLREQAQARANVSQAAALLSEQRVEEADALLRKHPLASIEPSREAAGVFRTLGHWNAIYGRWEQAVQCYTLLDQANRLDDPVHTIESTDVLAIAPVLRAYGPPGAYEKFRRETLERHLPAANALQAEHLLKAALLAPADKDFLAKLRETALTCAQDVPVESGSTTYPEWNAFSLTLYHHRLNDPERVLEWAGRSLTYPDATGTRVSATLCLTAMARSRLGDRAGAARDLAAARRMIERAPESGEALGSPTEGGFWFSWLVGRLLLEEADQEITGEAPSSVDGPA